MLSMDPDFPPQQADSFLTRQRIFAPRLPLESGDIRYDDTTKGG
jgi:hypothetical protein